MLSIRLVHPKRGSLRDPLYLKAPVRVVLVGQTTVRLRFHLGLEDDMMRMDGAQNNRRKTIVLVKVAVLCNNDGNEDDEVKDGDADL